ncbi:hypothetical protein BDQ12DRAFT_222854 [Crucibulum laeve]|uniref:Uncharacterized protein n=1 Tax=Crucibulum laeve TaxID=68775 RepID=A0A5C3LWN1_9AGAR|nr:hypothetical protein BDQ12DRAFT_222854 [Crucibulum laeve]
MTRFFSPLPSSQRSPNALDPEPLHLTLPPRDVPVRCHSRATVQFIAVNRNRSLQEHVLQPRVFKLVAVSTLSRSMSRATKKEAAVNHQGTVNLSSIIPSGSLQPRVQRAPLFCLREFLHPRHSHTTMLPDTLRAIESPECQSCTTSLAYADDSDGMGWK